MYIPPRYINENEAETIAFIKRFSFGVITTSINNVPTATHLPFVVSERGGSLFLTAHFAKANPHWQHIESNENLIIFSEPHAYISPKNYNEKQNVPTWNYLAVHAYGLAKLITDKDAVYKVLEAMINSFEADYKTQWDDLAEDYKTRMAKGIVAFEIEVTKIESKKKLSQNKKTNERQNIIQSLKDSSNNTDQLLGDYMQNEEE